MDQERTKIQENAIQDQVERTKEPAKEIDLMDLVVRFFQGIGFLFKKLGEGLLFLAKGLVTIIEKTFHYAMKHFWIVAIVTILGAGAGVGRNFMLTPYYETDMLVSTGIVPRTMVINRINNLQSFISDGNNGMLARELNLTPEEVKSLSSIKTDIIQLEAQVTRRKIVSVDEKTGKETTSKITEEEEGPEIIRIVIRLTDNRTIRRLSDAVINYVNNDKYIDERLKVAQTRNIAQQDAIKAQIIKLTEFQDKNIAKSSQVLQMSAGATMPMIVQDSERTYHTEILELNDQLSGLQASFTLMHPIEIVKNFTPLETPVNRLYINIFMGAFLGFALIFGILLLRDAYKKVKSV